MMRIKIITTINLFYFCDILTNVHPFFLFLFSIGEIDNYITMDYGSVRPGDSITVVSGTYKGCRGRFLRWPLKGGYVSVYISIYVNGIREHQPLIRTASIRFDALEEANENNKRTRVQENRQGRNLQSTTNENIATPIATTIPFDVVNETSSAVDTNNNINNDEMSALMISLVNEVKELKIHSNIMQNRIISLEDELADLKDNEEL